jgi:acetolactate synthase I/II/III large subunit
LMGVGAFSETHPLSLQWFGMHGAAYGNWAVDQCDVLICAGARFDDRITGDTSKFASGAKIVHIDIDASEHNKNKRAHLPITSDIKYALNRLVEPIPAPGSARSRSGNVIIRSIRMPASATARTSSHRKRSPRCTS